MRPAFTLLGIMTLIVSLGAYFTLSQKAEAPKPLPESNPSPVQSPMSLTLTSPVFDDKGKIPQKFTCDGENISPELHIENIPDGTESLVLVMDDPDIPDSLKKERGIEKFNHWVVYNIPADTRVIKEGELSGTLGMNGRGEVKYIGPCPPDREHRYIFRLYAVTGTLNFIQSPTLDQVEEAARGMMLESAVLTGRYERKNTAVE